MGQTHPPPERPLAARGEECQFRSAYSAPGTGLCELNVLFDKYLWSDFRVSVRDTGIRLQTQQKRPSTHSSLAASSVPTRTPRHYYCVGYWLRIWGLRGKVTFQGHTGSRRMLSMQGWQTIARGPNRAATHSVNRIAWKRWHTYVCPFCLWRLHATVAALLQQRPAKPELVTLQLAAEDVCRPLVLTTADVAAFEEIQIILYFRGPNIPLVSILLRFLPLPPHPPPYTFSYKEGLFSCKSE